ncbi:B3 domain-containing protein At5g42700-like [Chenopodium quinoa]|uniref:TF-B3 domain-containing protein n=1 Tax=Chenopodium quinoa TaxID=63459 RepID=A0A803N8J4_CHEQI|nr:B3 domain-containing protein At5g42700-like [Chenopodium quinoa]
MGIGNTSYEERRQKRVEQNKKRLEDLNLIHLSQALKNLSPKSSPMKKVGKPRIIDKQTVEVRRSARVASNPAPVYAEISLPRFSSPRKSYGVVKARDFTNRVIASDDVREYAIEEAEKLNAKLEEEGFPTLVRPMLPSHVTGGFWLGLPTDFCRRSLPTNDGMVTLVDEENEEYPVVYLARKRGLSGGWKGFAESHELVDGDAVIFQVISSSVLKVYIIRGSGQDSGTD